MRYNDKALEKGAWCTAVNPCAECQAYDTNTGKRSYHRAFLLKCVSTSGRGAFCFLWNVKINNEKISKNS